MNRRQFIVRAVGALALFATPLRWLWDGRTRLVPSTVTIPYEALEDPLNFIWAQQRGLHEAMLEAMAERAAQDLEKLVINDLGFSA